MNTENCNFEKKEWDVCIIGSGPAGIAVANELKGTSLKVLILESGKVDPPLYDVDADGLNEGQMGHFLKNAWDARTPSTYLRWIRQRGFGGTTSKKTMWWNHEFGGWCRPLSEIDFERGWPSPLHNIENLAKYYRRAQDFCGLGLYENYDNPKFWIDTYKDKPLQVLSRRTGDYDLDTAVFNVIGKIRGQDAREFQKTQALNDPNITVCRGFTAQYLELDNTRSVKTLIVKTLDDLSKEYRVRAKRYVLAMGCLENARFLLISYARVNKDANGIGEHFTTHPQYSKVAGFYVGDDFTQAVRNFFSEHTIVSGENSFNFFACWVPAPAYLRPDAIPNFRFTLKFSESPSDPMIANTQTDVERETGKEGSDGLYCTVGLAWEQVPNPKSKVTLDSSATDRFGQSQLLCDWNLTETDRTTAVEAMKCLIRQVTGRLRKNNPDVYFMDFTQSEWPDDGPYKGPQPSHEMGTTRMSEPGGDGVVDSDCQMHDFDNVYIAGSSVFTRVGWANPTLTIIALAIRLGEHLTNPKPPIYK